MAAQPATGAAPASADPAAQRPDRPLGALVYSAANLLQDADPIDSPLRYVSVSRTQSIDVQFDPGDPATLHALAKWAERVRRDSHQPVVERRRRAGDRPPGGVPLLRRGGVRLHRHPGRTGRHLTRMSAGPGGLPSPGPASQTKPHLAKEQEILACLRLPARRWSRPAW
jgi:hypothetical protein